MTIEKLRNKFTKTSGGKHNNEIRKPHDDPTVNGFSTGKAQYDIHSSQNGFTNRKDRQIRKI